MNLVTPVREDILQMDTAASLVSEPGAAAQTLLTGALNYCIEKMSLIGPQAALDSLAAGNQAAHSYFQFALARQVAVYLAGLDNEVTAVYLYDFEATPEDIVFGKLDSTPTPHLIVRARRKTEALNALSGALGQALAARYAEMAGLPASRNLLAIQFVDDAEDRRGTGYAALLRSFNLRPLLVWQR